jgi:hypothetical protein
LGSKPPGNQEIEAVSGALMRVCGRDGGRELASPTKRYTFRCSVLAASVPSGRV